MDPRSRFLEVDDEPRPDSYLWHPATQQPRPAPAWQGPPPPPNLPSSLPDRPSPLRRGLSILARHPSDSQEDDLHASLSGTGPRGRSRLKKRTLAGAHVEGGGAGSTDPGHGDESRAHGKEKGRAKWKRIIGGNGPVDGWMVYCWLLTCWVPAFVLRAVFGKRTVDSQRAWREKMGLVGIILAVMGFVGYLTFGFTITVCGVPELRYHSGQIPNGSLIINGWTYDLGNWNHPSTAPPIGQGTFNGSQNPLFMEDWMAGGKDASFLFQQVNQACMGIITPTANSSITHDGDNMSWYFPCNLRGQNGSATADLTNTTSSWSCHTSDTARRDYAGLKRQGQVYFDWKDVKNEERNLAVYQGRILDLSLLNWLSRSLVSYPALYDDMADPQGSNATLWRGRDLTMYAQREQLGKEMDCLSEVIGVGFVSGQSIGCMASQVVLYVSLIFIIGIVAIKFGMAVVFGWFLSWRLGSFSHETYAERMKRSEAIENWTEDIYRVAPSRYRPNVQSTYAAGGGGGGGPKKGGSVWMPTTSRFSKIEIGRPGTMYAAPGMSPSSTSRGMSRSRTDSTYFGSRPTPAPLAYNQTSTPSLTSLPSTEPAASTCPWPLDNVVPQPPESFEPFNFPLQRTLLLVTAYSETVEGLRTTLDSLATTDYPNSHKCIMVVVDGMVRGSGSALHTIDIVLGMMTDLVVPVAEVQPHSFVAIADGHKKHNMAKVFAGFYDYDDDTVETSKQQRVPIVLVAKVGNPQEASDSKPGNRGKRDSQIILMGFLQKAIFDERMTTFEYELFNAMWRVTGITPDRYETVLCVDADTKVFPDSVTRMNSAMHRDPGIMGLCGETKVANKGESWVTMIQVFEYYISHHQTKAFESVFGGVTCLPGCFSMYRIKARKGTSNYWVPILASPDIVDAYSQNIVDTLHKKNLLLLGEDRYLSTLMLKTFPRRKMIFLPQAVCKTIVPDTFRVLLSQRRRWINSTIHNLFELLFVPLCGSFCFSMQFVVFIDLVGTLALPAALSFTCYLVVIAIIPSQPTPTMSLILLALILGLPALLIVVTSRKISYIGWMLVYLLSLPIWNFVLPAYAYWHFDDFSWGETRRVEGEVKGGAGHGDKDGVFDSRNIVMKRWAEFERERRWKLGETSRPESYFDLITPQTPRRESLASTHTSAEYRA